MNEYMTTDQVAFILGVSKSWLYAQFTQKIIEDLRDSRTKGAPYLYGLRELTELFISRDCRKAGIGYDAIRATVDDMNNKGHRRITNFGNGIHLIVDFGTYRMLANQHFKRTLRVA